MIIQVDADALDRFRDRIAKLEAALAAEREAHATTKRGISSTYTVAWDSTPAENQRLRAELAAANERAERAEKDRQLLRDVNAKLRVDYERDENLALYRHEVLEERQKAKAAEARADALAAQVEDLRNGNAQAFQAAVERSCDETLTRQKHRIRDLAAQVEAGLAACERFIGYDQSAAAQQIKAALSASSGEPEQPSGARS